MKLRINSSLSININSIIVIMLIIFFSFQRIFISFYPKLKYMDEVFFIVTVCEILILSINNKKLFNKTENEILILMIFLFFVGVIGNLNSRLLNDKMGLVTDIISTFKVFISYYWIRKFKLTHNDWEEIIIILAKIFRIIIFIMFTFYILSYIFKFNMLYEIRFGLSSYRFMFDNPGNFSKVFYIIIPLLSIDLYFDRKKAFYKKTVIALSLILWCSTLRTRAIVFSICYILFAFWFFYLRKNHKQIKLINVLPIIIIGLIIGWEQLLFYFTNETQTRFQLLKYGLVTLKDYFPIGAGFGVYGSDVAVSNYSLLYYKYGFKNIYGMGLIHTNFLNDNYWPMIMGQFGIMGIIIVIILLFKLFKMNLNNLKKNDYYYFSTVILIGFLLLSSIASKSYSEFTSIPIFMLHGILYQLSLGLRNNEN